MQKELIIVKNFGENLIDESTIDYIRFDFEVLPYESRFFMEDPALYINAVTDELDNDGIKKHFPIWMKENNLEFCKLELGKEDTGILYLSLETKDINLCIIDSFRLFMESDKFKFKFKPEAGSI